MKAIEDELMERSSRVFFVCLLIQMSDCTEICRSMGTLKLLVFLMSNLPQVSSYYYIERGTSVTMDRLLNCIIYFSAKK